MADLSLLNDVGCESSCIATLIFHPEFILHTDYLKAKYFYSVEDGCIYWAISQLYKAGVDNIDAINLTNMLNSNKAVKKTIANYNIENIQEFVNLAQYSARHTLEEYKLLAQRVCTLSFKRELIKKCISIEKTCMNNNSGLKELNTLVNDEISSLMEQYLTTTEIETFGEKIDAIQDDIDSSINEDGTSGFPSKIKIFNDYFTYEKGEVVLIKARKKDGKSCFLLNQALYLLKENVPTLYVDTEMSDKLFWMRVISSLTGFNFKDIKNRSYKNDPQKVKTYEYWKNWLKKQPFVHVYLPAPTKEEVYAMCKILKYKMNLQFVVYDYIKLDEPDTGRNYNLLGDLTNFLKNQVAGELELAMLAAAQLNRNNQVADSDKLERYISTSIWWRPKTQEQIDRDGVDCGNYAATIDVNRNGEQMDRSEYIDILFSGNQMRITQAKKQHDPIQTMPFS